MVVEDVVYENSDEDQSSMTEKMFRRLIFKRNSGLVQSEALLVKDSTSDKADENNKKSPSASKKRRNQKKGPSGMSCKFKVSTYWYARLIAILVVGIIHARVSHPEIHEP